MAAPTVSDFRLDQILVRPSLNRLERGGAEHQLEPKMMDVLVVLAESPGEVVSKRQLHDRVWAEVFVTDSVITRAIAGLRRALGDDAASPRFIQTIARRGYRLMVPPGTAPGGDHGSRNVRDAAAGRRFAVGRWVCGDGFVGRETELREILEGPRHGLWVMGSRAVGKTSLLRHVQLLARDPQRAELPLYWDLQGSETGADLAQCLDEALLDTADDLAAAGVDLETCRTDDAARTLSAWRRACRSAGRRPVLLCDEAEALITVADSDPGQLARLRRALLASADLTCVLAASPRLWRLAVSTADTSPFLHGFVPPVPLGMLRDTEAVELLSGCLDEASEDDLATACAACGNHPTLLHLCGAAWRELEGVEAAVDRVAADLSVNRLFAADWELADDGERRVLLALSRARRPPADSAAESALHQLRSLGVVVGSGDGLRIRGRLLAQWVRGLDAAATVPPANR